MQIAGGLYQESCEVTHWDALFGSGGRAAAVVASLAGKSTLHTYAAPSNCGLSTFEDMGVCVVAYSAPTTIAFAYFHPLSQPHIQPLTIKRQAPIQVSGEVVLRFGLLEGDAVVSATRAIYDPQTHKQSNPFHTNGSRAQHLALVLNESELEALAGTHELSSAAATLMREQGATVVVVKRGLRGAMVFERGTAPMIVPAYHSERVFKIGTGDVFSAAFAFHWGEEARPASEAADLASRTVAAYCAKPGFPLQPELSECARPLPTSSPGVVLLEGQLDTLGQRYTLEEARFCLTQLGVPVACPALEQHNTTDSPSAILVVADGLGTALPQLIEKLISAAIPVIVLAESKAETVPRVVANGGLTTTDDFATALYLAGWAAMERSSHI